MIETMFDSFLAADLGNQILIGLSVATGGCVLFGGLRTLWKIALPLRWSVGKGFRGLGNAFYKAPEAAPQIIYKEKKPELTIEERMNLGSLEEIRSTVQHFEDCDRDRVKLSDEQLEDLISIAREIDMEAYDYQYLRELQDERSKERRALQFVESQKKRRENTIKQKFAREQADAERLEKAKKIAKSEEFKAAYAEQDAFVAGQSMAKTTKTNPWLEAYPGAFKKGW